MTLVAFDSIDGGILAALDLSHSQFRTLGRLR